MKKIISKYYISVIEFFIFVFGIVLTLVVEGKFEDYIPYTKKHPLNSIVIVVVILLALFVVKIMHEIKKYNAEEELLKASKENTQQVTISVFHS